MSRKTALVSVTTVVFVLSMARYSAAQPVAPPQLPRADVAGAFGWLNGNESDRAPTRWRNSWYNRGLYGGAIAGWYITEHHKAEIEVGASSAARLRTPLEVSYDGLPAYGLATFTFATRRVAAGYQYQFLHNAWVHPHAGVGIDVVAERITETDEPVVGYDGRTTIVVRDGRTLPPRTETHVRPFYELGLKAYLTQRGFFRTDVRLVGGSRLDAVIVRVGFGVDF